MRCIEPGCRVRGMKAADKDDDPIALTETCMIHNHRPDFERRTRLMFVHRCIGRAASEINMTINQIWESEVAKWVFISIFFLVVDYIYELNF